MAKLLVANWKMHPETMTEAESLFLSTVAAAETSRVSIVVCPPFEYLLNLVEKRGKVMVGAQDVFWKNAGPYTGEVSPTMLSNAGITHVIIGHSERREWLGETDEMVNKKVKAALAADLTAIVCVGEPKEIQNEGPLAARTFVMAQVAKALDGVDAKDAEKVIVAYEPVWAISSNKPDVLDTPSVSGAMIAEIKRTISEEFHFTCRALYGGSVDEKNIVGFLSHPEIDGALVGSASLRAEEFARMIGMVA